MVYLRARAKLSPQIKPVACGETPLAAAPAGSVSAGLVEAFAIRPLERGPAGRTAGEFAHAGVRLQGIDVRHLLPEVARGPAHRVQHPLDPGDMAPAAAAALRAEQLFQPFVAEHQHRIGLDHQLCPFVAHPPRLQLLRREQMQEKLLPVALNPLLRVGRAE
jgi:hypothetical protein